MPERAILREQFAQMLRASREAAEQYEALAQAADEPARREQLERLAREGYRHVELTERLIEIVNE